MKKSNEEIEEVFENADNLELKKAIDEVNSELNKLEEFFLHETQEIESKMIKKIKNSNMKLINNFKAKPLI